MPFPKFKDPYAGLPLDQLARPTFDCSLVDNQLLKSIVPGRGAIQTTLQLLTFKLLHELRKRDITDVTSADIFRNLIGELCDPDSPEFGTAIDGVLLRIGAAPDPAPAKLRGSASGVADGQAVNRDEPHRTERVLSETSEEPSRTSDAPRNPAVGSRGRGNRGAKGKTTKHRNPTH